MLQDLIVNVALLVVLSIFYGGLVRYRSTHPLLVKILMGLLFGSLAIIGMNIPFSYSEGVFYDGRSIIFSLAGLFGGGIVALISGVIVAIYRILIGGAGVYAGVATIASTVLMGLWVRRRLVGRFHIPEIKHLIFVGVGSHLLMLASQLLLPWPQGLDVIAGVGPSVMILFPLATLFIGLLMISSERRLAAEQVLKENESLYRTTLNSLGDAVILTDIEMNVVEMNPAACRMTGWPVSEAKGRPVGEVFKVVNENDLEPVENPVEKVIESGRKTEIAIEAILISRDGRRIPIADRGSPVVNDHGENLGVVLVFQDRTETMKKQKEVEESEGLFRRLFEKHTAVKMLIDPVDGRIVGANDAAAEFYGWSREHLLNMNIDQINTLSIDEIKAKFVLVEQGQRTYFQFQHRKADESISDVQVFASQIIIKGRPFIHSIVHDVSDKKRIEQELKLLSASVRQNPVGVIITDAFMRIEYVNPKYTDLTGLGLEDVAGIKPGILDHKYVDVDLLENEILETLKAREIWNGEYRLERKEGKPFWGKIMISPIEDAFGNVTNYLLLYEDISVLKRVMKDLEEAKNKAEESEQMKTAFLANMSHEIRTPLNGILGFTELLTSHDGFSFEQRQEFGTIIQKSSEGLLQIINDVLEVSRIESEKLSMESKPFVLNETLSAIRNLYIRKMEELGKSHLSLKLEMPDQAVEVTGDENRLQQVLINLLDNALKFTAEGGIVFGVSNVENGKVELIVKDTGIGIRPEKQEIIFERFSQADNDIARKYGGTGLGLAIVKKLTSLMGDGISLDSEEGKGSVFRFSLPGRFTT
ncbi:PAS domain S-box protein [Marinilabilia rubra]|uniref:histidine kinase n=1 Tax=Marinilabilia rubra TaxID=2162893 RepID=A0A2U2B7U8_9BACT|nr:PAS domain S-box protein [Marinilabilia rubra]PWD99149.1 hypothetical protein DDZ16_11155 [Marinilabilia rubra]